ncbi:MAG: dihydroorotase [Rikenellaceae bacterium]|nr:dihydroorotase [Rikenellaceae bacterium]
MKTFYTNALIYRQGGFAPGSLVVDEGRFVEADAPVEGDRVVDLQGRRVVPGLIDVHVHLREPGFGYKETIATGTAAAARGGYTTVCSMPNLNPAPDSLAALGEQLALIERDAVVRVVPYGCITKGQQGGGEQADLAAMAPSVVGFSDDGRGVQADEDMLRAMQEAARIGKPIVAHCEVNELLRGGYIHDGAYCRAHGHRGICSESEWAQVKRDIELVEQTGCQYHVCHVSTKESVELVRAAKAKGLPVSCETGPHYLVLCDEQLQEEGRWKMNPPIRSAADRDALVAGLQDGTIEVIATDHAPHSAEEKGRGLERSAMGIVGLECAFGVLYTHLVEKGLLSLEALIDRMATNPGRLFGLGGVIETGAPADFTVLDLETEYEIDPETFLSKGRATPFAGWRVKGRAAMTVVGGKCVYEA